MTPPWTPRDQKVRSAGLPAPVPGSANGARAIPGRTENARRGELAMRRPSVLALPGTGLPCVIASPTPARAAARTSAPSVHAAPKGLGRSCP
ncbi:MAG: hypothetical protein EXR95_08610 [Gemmatimonadetes bacterium]|nr:hypothetical protein [Gemmatimonadota bacterium]